MYQNKNNKLTKLQYQPTLQTRNTYQSSSVLDQPPQLISIYDQELSYHHQKKKSVKCLQYGTNKKNNVQNLLKNNKKYPSHKSHYLPKYQPIQQKFSPISNIPPKHPKSPSQQYPLTNPPKKPIEPHKTTKHLPKNQSNIDIIQQDNFHKFLDLEDYSSIQKNQSLQENLTEFQQDKQYAKYLNEFAPKLIKKPQPHPLPITTNNTYYPLRLSATQTSTNPKIKATISQRSSYHHHQSKHPIYNQIYKIQHQKNQPDPPNKSKYYNKIKYTNLDQPNTQSLFNAYSIINDIFKSCIHVCQLDNTTDNIKISQDNNIPVDQNHEHVQQLINNKQKFKQQPFKYQQQQSPIKSSENLLQIILTKPPKLFNFLTINNELQICLNNLQFQQNIKTIQDKYDIYLKTTPDDDTHSQHSKKTQLSNSPTTAIQYQKPQPPSSKKPSQSPLIKSTQPFSYPPSFYLGLSFSKSSSLSPQVKKQQNCSHDLCMEDHNLSTQKNDKSNFKYNQILDILALLLIKLSKKKCTFYFNHQFNSNVINKNHLSKQKNIKTNSQKKLPTLTNNHSFLLHPSKTKKNLHKTLLSKQFTHSYHQPTTQSTQNLQQILQKVTTVVQYNKLIKIQFQQYFPQPSIIPSSPISPTTTTSPPLTYPQKIKQLKSLLNSKNKQIQSIITQCDEIVANYVHCISSLQQNKLKSNNPSHQSLNSNQPISPQYNQPPPQLQPTNPNPNIPSHHQPSQPSQSLSKPQQIPPIISPHNIQQPTPLILSTQFNNDQNNIQQSHRLTGNSLSISGHKTQNNQLQTNKTISNYKSWN